MSSAQHNSGVTSLSVRAVPSIEGMTWLRYRDEKTFLAMIDWLSDLEWSTEGDIAVVEAAIDLELFSGLNVKAPSKTAKTHREKANIIRCMLNAISKLAGHHVPAPPKSARQVEAGNAAEEGSTVADDAAAKEEDASSVGSR
eukprot:gene11058-16994_t